MSIREYDFVSGVETSDLPDPTDAVADQDIANYGQIKNEFTSRQTFENNVLSLTALKAIASANRYDNQLVSVEIGGEIVLFWFDAASADGADDIFIVQPDAGTGRWIRQVKNTPQILDEGSPLGFAKKIDFVGAGVSVGYVSDTATVTIPGGGGGSSDGGADPIEILLSQGQVRNSAYNDGLSLQNNQTNTAEGYTLKQETNIEFRAVNDYRTNLVFKIDVINAGDSIEVQDGFDKSADMLIGDTVRIFREETIGGVSKYIDAEIVKTLDANASHSLGTTTIPLSDTTDLLVGDYVIPEDQVTHEISFVNAGSPDSFQSLTKSTSEVVEGVAIDGIIPDLAHYWRLGTALSNGQTEPDLGSYNVDLIVRGWNGSGNITNATVSLTTTAGNVDIAVQGFDAVRGGNSACLFDPGGDNNPQVLGIGAGSWNKTFTMGFWANWQNSSATNIPIGGGADGSFGWGLFRDGGAGTRLIFAGGQSSTWAADSGGAWIHYMIQAVYSGGYTVSVYRNNSLVLSGFSGGTPTHKTGANERSGWFIIGSGGAGDGSSGVNGADLGDKFEEVFFVERTLTTQERSDIYNSGSGARLDKEVVMQERLESAGISGRILKSRLTVKNASASQIVATSHGVIKKGI